MAVSAACCYYPGYFGGLLHGLLCLDGDFLKSMLGCAQVGASGKEVATRLANGVRVGFRTLAET
jgi:hypothetical protein